MKFKFKFIILGSMLYASLLRADLFNFRHDSLLNEEQQIAIKTIFMEKMLEGGVAFVEYLKNSSYNTIIKAFLNDQTELKKVLLGRLFVRESKQFNKRYVKNFILNTTKSEDFLFILKEDMTDGLFNAIIRESIRVFIANYMEEYENKREIIREVFNVLWKGITNKNLTCSIDYSFVNSIYKECGHKLESNVICQTINIFQSAQGCFCDKIATALAHLLYVEYNNAAENASNCCACLRTTGAIFKKIFPALSTVMEVALNIAKIVI